jgi:tetratricopeptide (TPR) repeat protein
MNPLRALPWAAQRVHGVRLLGHAAAQLIAPTDLVTLYGPGSFPLDRVADGFLALGAATLLALGALAWRARRAAPWVSFASLAYALTAGAVCSVFAVYSVMYAERLMLLPSAFVALLFGAAVDRAAAQRPRVAGGFAGALLASYVALFALRAPDWRDARALGRATVAVHPDDAVALTMLGIFELAARDTAAAYGYCRAATERAPNFAGAWGCVGAALATRGSFEAAAAAYARMEGGHWPILPFEGSYAVVLVSLGRRDAAARQLASIRARGFWGPDAQHALNALRAPPRAPAPPRSAP